MRTTIQTIICTLLLFFTSQILSAQTIVELETSKDNVLYETTEGDISNGIGQYLFAGVNGTGDIRRAIIQFDLSEIPDGAQIESAELKLYMDRSATTDVKSVEVFEVLKDWGEGVSDGTDGGRGEGRGGDATEGDVTWINTFFPDEMWDNPGGDYTSTGVTSLDIDGIDYYTWPSTPDMVTLVQKWLDTPDENHGIILLGDETVSRTAKRFGSRQNANEDQRPVLIVEYSGETTSTDVLSDIPQSVQLQQNYPNPFNPTTSISFSVPEATFAEIAVYDILGRKLQTLLSERVQAGQHATTFDASTLSSGVYLYTLQTENQRLTRRLTVLK